MSWTTADIPDQSGRTAIVTGANAGLGLETTAVLAAAGAHVVLACRNQAKAQAAVQQITARVPKASLEVASLDLADLASVRSFADSYRASHSTLDLLINNAGLMAVDQSTTTDGFETQLGVNHLGHFALTAGLLPLLMATPGSRIASMSSMGHRAATGFDVTDLMFTRRRYDRWRPYFQSKLANLYFTAELQRRLTQAGAPTIAVSAHPGASSTDLGFEGSGFTNLGTRLLMPVAAQPASRGAQPMLRAATDPGVRAGEFYGPRWLVRGHAVRETPSRLARNAANALALWDASAELTGVTPTFTT